MRLSGGDGGERHTRIATRTSCVTAAPGAGGIQSVCFIKTSWTRTEASLQWNKHRIFTGFPGFCFLLLFPQAILDWVADAALRSALEDVAHWQGWWLCESTELSTREKRGIFIAAAPGLQRCGACLWFLLARWNFAFLCQLGLPARTPFHFYLDLKFLSEENFCLEDTDFPGVCYNWLYFEYVRRLVSCSCNWDLFFFFLSLSCSGKCFLLLSLLIFDILSPTDAHI